MTEGKMVYAQHFLWKEYGVEQLEFLSFKTRIELNCHEDDNFGDAFSDGLVAPVDPPEGISPIGFILSRSVA